MPEIKISTSKKQEIIDITDAVQSIVTKSKVKEGICHVYVKHATAAIIINENWDPNICLDLIDCLNAQIAEGVWRHDNVDGNGASHLKAAILGPQEVIPISNGKLDLGRWQSIMLTDFDGPRDERVIKVTILSSKE